SAPRRPPGHRLPPSPPRRRPRVARSVSASRWGAPSSAAPRAGGAEDRTVARRLTPGSARGVGARCRRRLGTLGAVEDATTTGEAVEETPLPPGYPAEWDAD